jgi:hypothetical protein
MPPNFELGGIDFDCGVEEYNEWLNRHAKNAVSSGSASVYLLVETASDRCVGYFTLSPTQVVKADMPKGLHGGLMRATPGFLIGKLALDKTCQTRWRKANGLDPLPQSLGPDLLRAAVLKAVEAARIGGGQVIVIDADNEGLVPYYRDWGFIPADGPGQLRLYMKMSTARTYSEL